MVVLVDSVEDVEVAVSGVALSLPEDAEEGDTGGETTMREPVLEGLKPDEERPCSLACTIVISVNNVQYVDRLQYRV